MVIFLYIYLTRLYNTYIRGVSTCILETLFLYTKNVISNKYLTPGGICYVEP